MYVYLIELSPLGLFRANETNYCNKLNTMTYGRVLQIDDKSMTIVIRGEFFSNVAKREKQKAQFWSCIPWEKHICFFFFFYE